jgi:hypothetical protein
LSEAVEFVFDAPIESKSAADRDQDVIAVE